MNTPNYGTSKYMRQTLIEVKGEVDKSTIVVRDLNIPLSVINRSSRWKISKDTAELDSTVNLVI